MVSGKNVRVEWTKKDRCGRILGIVHTDGAEVILEMVKQGFAWHCKHFGNTPAYAEAQTDARASERGLWPDPSAQNPLWFGENPQMFSVVSLFQRTNRQKPPSLFTKYRLRSPLSRKLSP